MALKYYQPQAESNHQARHLSKIFTSPEKKKLKEDISVDVGHAVQRNGNKKNVWNSHGTATSFGLPEPQQMKRDTSKDVESFRNTVQSIYGFKANLRHSETSNQSLGPSVASS